MAVRKKQDDKYLLALRELVNSCAGNRQCFDCNQKGPTYVNMTIGSFVCTRCSGVLRGLTPPHRVKSISMATFTQEEVDFLKAHGNESSAKTWLGLWDPKRAAPQQDQRELMIDKYERKRYYLEPASPLKSLTNAVNLKSYTSNGIHLTPPAAQRTAANGLHKTTPPQSNSNSNTVTASMAISRPQHSQHSTADAFNMPGLNLSSLNSAGSTSTGALSDTSSCASNGFAGESDFVADFGAANIFDATSARNAASPVPAALSSLSSSNGYAKVQPLRAAHLQQQQQQLQLQQQQQQQQQLLFNFADFEHAPIYNAVADWSDWSTTVYHDPFKIEPQIERKQELLPSWWRSDVFDDDCYEAEEALSTLSPTNPFRDYLEQSSSYEDEPIDTNSKTDTDTVTDTICQLSYNPFVTWPTAQQKQSQSSVKAPSEDRYAALKDLDEQLRELKASETVSTDLSAAQLNGNGNGNADPFNYNNNTVNPFKSQQQQQQPTQQPQLLNGSRQVVNPFQANNNQQQQQKNLYGQLTLIPNGYHHHQQQQQQEHQLGAGANFYNFNNNGFAVSQGLPNGCGFGSIMQPAPVMAGGMSGAYNNPFAASGAINTNNPFL